MGAYNEKTQEPLSDPQANQPMTSPNARKGTVNIVDLVIPSNLLPSDQSNPFVAGAEKKQSDLLEKDAESSFDARKIALQQKEEVERALTRSASVSVGTDARSTAIGYDSRDNDFVVKGRKGQFRKTSLPESQETDFGRRPSQFRSLNSANSDRQPQLHDLPLPDKTLRSTDYFGNFNFNARPSQRHTPPATEWPSPREGEPPNPDSDPAPTIFTRVSIDRSGTRQSRSSINREHRKASVVQRAGSIVADVVADAVHTIQNTVRRSSLYDIYEKAKTRGAQLQRSKWAMRVFQYACYLILVSFVYFVLVGVPLWKGAVYWLWWVFSHKFTVAGTWAVIIGVAVFYAYTPLFILFEKDPPIPEAGHQDPRVSNTALMIPCYKSAKIIGPTLEAAVKIFPPSHIFVIANGNSPTPLDNTEEVCRPYGVNHVWSPIGSKIVAQFIGCYAAKGFKNILLIDDDCALPPNFPIVSDRMTETIKCIGYTIKSVGPESSRGTFCQQAQDLEYKISGIQRALAGMIGSATFPHGAISLWDLDFLIQTFRQHPGFSVSEDWFFGHVARELGSRITMCTSVFIETETPSAVFFSSGGARGGFGEMTIFKQRFLRWNFFFVNGMWYNMKYIIASWRLGFWELGKLFCALS